MDYMTEIMKLDAAAQAQALKLLQDLQDEFAAYAPDYNTMDRLEYQLDQLLNVT